MTEETREKKTKDSAVVTFLIGNGFDIGLGLETKYADFVTAYLKEASCITVGLFDTDSGVKRCEHGAQSAECLQRAA